jgi:membrane-associated phospholipid phosphatase
MHGLEAWDTGLFRLINQRWSNPVFDVVMPWLSGNRLFVPLVLAAAAWLLWRYRWRGALCMAMLGIILPLGDTYVCRPLKAAIARPRPFVTQPDTRLLTGAGGKHASLPSSHAANWFAGAMIGWFFFRRSVRVTLPLAAAVSYSRVYNGVHYPSDVLAGAILGAGYAVAGVVALQSAWSWIGKRWFPLWWEKMPSLLLGPQSGVNGAPNGQRAVPGAASAPPRGGAVAAVESHWLRAGYVVIAVVLLARWAYLASGTMELSEDEAYQWLWSKRPALSYFSKPPMIAYTQWLGTRLWGDTEFGVRFFSPLIGALLGVLLLRFFAREVNARAGFLLVLVCTATPLLAAGSILMTVDPLLVLFWTAAMLAGWKAIRPESGVAAWCWVGLWTGLGFLSKYTALLQWLCWAVLFALWPPARVHLRRPGPYLALLLNAVCALPVVIWNSQHGWITAAHVADNAQLGKPWSLAAVPGQFFGFLGAEAGLLNPVFFVGVLAAAVLFWRTHRNDLRVLFFFSMGAPLFLVYLLWTFYARVQPNWIAASVLPLFCMAMIYWDDRARRGARFVNRWLAAGLVLGLSAVVLGHKSEWIEKITGRPLPARQDPLRRVRGWSEVARTVGEERARLLAEGKPVFIIGGHYGITSLITFYLPEARARVPHDPLVFYRTSPRPVNQFYFWPGYRDRKGQNAIYVEENRRPEPPPDILRAEFESVTDLGLREIRNRGRVLRTLQLFECRNLR